MLAVATLLSSRTDAPARQLIGAAHLAALMATARMELRREQTFSRAAEPNAAPESASAVRAQRRA